MRDFFDTIVCGQALMMQSNRGLMIVMLLIASIIISSVLGGLFNISLLTLFGYSISIIDLTVAYMIGRRAGK